MNGVSYGVQCTSGVGFSAFSPCHFHHIKSVAIRKPSVIVQFERYLGKQNNGYQQSAGDGNDFDDVRVLSTDNVLKCIIKLFHIVSVLMCKNSSFKVRKSRFATKLPVLFILNKKHYALR